jgi:hypothetical protein
VDEIRDAIRPYRTEKQCANRGKELAGVKYAEVKKDWSSFDHRLGRDIEHEGKYANEYLDAPGGDQIKEPVSFIESFIDEFDRLRHQDATNKDVSARLSSAKWRRRRLARAFIGANPAKPAAPSASLYFFQPGFPNRKFIIVNHLHYQLFGVEIRDELIRHRELFGS